MSDFSSPQDNWKVEKGYNEVSGVEFFTKYEW